jgi:hypothetical protein
VAAATNVGECVERLLQGFTTYDRAVDVVSAFEMLYTESKTMVPSTVRHFERFPRVPDEAGAALKPDFSVVFNDGGGLVGEISRLALPEGSADDLCDQIERYDALRELPVPGGLAEVSYTDVLLLVPGSVGVAAVKRIVVERYANPAHRYAPAAAPCVVQFVFDEDRYIFQRLLEPMNGMPRDGQREDGLARWFEESGDIKVRPGRFSDIKAQRAFMNDPIDPLYLATHLWAKAFPTMAGASVARPLRLEFESANLAAQLRTNFGGIRSSDIDRAMGLLKAGKLAERTATGWVAAWEELRVTGEERDLAHLLAMRACRPPERGALARLAASEHAAGLIEPPPPTLF